MNRWLWPLGLFLVLVVFLGVGLTLNPREVPSPLISKAAPPFQLPQLHEPEKTFSQKDMAGKVWLLNVWASWCASCRVEHPLLMDLAKSGAVPIYLFLLIIFLCGIASATAAEDPALERRVKALSEELRCLVCQNQSLADSNADLAIDLKNQVREKLKQGASEKDVITFMTERYGDFVLYRPPVKATTWLLWFGPGLLMVAGLVALFMRLRRRATVAAEPALSADERARAAALLDSGADAGRR